MDTLLREGPSQSGPRLGARVVGAFGALGLLLAAVGLWGVVSYSVAQRMHEFGIRTALGATGTDITRLAIARGTTLTAVGLAFGCLAALGVTPFMAPALVGVHPRDPVVFAATGLLLAAVTLLACLAPSRRAASADPLATLNAE